MAHQQYNMHRHNLLGMGILTPTPLLILTLHRYPIRIPTIHLTAAIMGAPACTSAFPAYSLTSDSAVGISATSGMEGISATTSEAIAPGDAS